MMPNASQSESGMKLDEQIDQLVGEMSEATAQIRKQVEEAELSDEAYAEKMGLTQSPLSDEAIASPKAAPESKTEPEAAHESSDQDVPESSEKAEDFVQDSDVSEQSDDSHREQASGELDASVEEMLEGAAQEGVPATERADALATEVQEHSAVDRVDAELAELADEMLDGDFDDVEDVLSAPEPASEPVSENESSDAPQADEELQGADSEEVGGSAEEDEDALEGAFDDGDDVIESGEPEPVPAPKPKHARPTSTITTTADADEEPEPIPAPDLGHADDPESESARGEAGSDEGESPGAEIDADTAADTAVETKPSGKRAGLAFAASVLRVRRALYAVIEKSNKPLDDKPAHFRDIAGWLAVVTLFNAVCVWAFVLIVRGPAPGTSTEPSVGLAGSEQQPPDQSARASIDTASIDPDSID